MSNDDLTHENFDFRGFDVPDLKAVTLGEGKLAAADLSAIASRLKAGAVLDFAEATYEAAEFPTVFSRKTTLREISLPCNILTMPSTGTYATAFYGCTGLETVALPDGLTEIFHADFDRRVCVL